MKIAFWNTHKNNNINSYLVKFIKECNLDLMILAEYTDDVEQLLDALRQDNIIMHNYPTTGCDRIVMLGTYSNVDMGFQGDYCSIQIINGLYICVGIHLPSKRNCSGRQRDITIRKIIYEIEAKELEISSDYTFVVGDFNENPYESGCLSADEFHAMADYNVSKRLSRTIYNNKFKMFYNPMWNMLGDFNFPSGTYYYNGNDACNPFWNTYDQVMIRPALREHFIDCELKIVYEINGVSLINSNGRPNKGISDHLPIVFEIAEV